MAGRVAMSLIAVPMVPIENFNPQELDVLIALVRAKLGEPELLLEFLLAVRQRHGPSVDAEGRNLPRIY